MGYVRYDLLPLLAAPSTSRCFGGEADEEGGCRGGGGVAVERA